MAYVRKFYLVECIVSPTGEVLAHAAAPVPIEQVPRLHRRKVSKEIPVDGPMVNVPTMPREKLPESLCSHCDGTGFDRLELAKRELDREDLDLRLEQEEKARVAARPRTLRDMVNNLFRSRHDLNSLPFPRHRSQRRAHIRSLIGKIRKADNG